MLGEKNYMDYEDSNVVQQNETTILVFARLDAWIKNFLKSPGTDEIHGGARQKIFVETFLYFLRKVIKQMFRLFDNLLH